jgi:hypothetical protein
MTDRVHCYRVIQNAAGDLQPGAVVRVLQPGTDTLVGDPLYPDNDTVTPMTNPFNSVDGTINFYLDLPQRIRLGVTQPGQNEVFFDDVDLLLDSNSTFDQNHTGGGVNSMTIGTGSASPGAGAVALGNTASADGSEATSVGHNADGEAADSVALGSAAVSTGTGGLAAGKSAAASGTNAVAAGKLSAASGNNAVALGDNVVSSAARGTALGGGASATHIHATAVGSQAATTEAQQVKLGQVTDFVDIPNFLTLKSNPGLVKYRLYIRDDGTLAIRYHFPLDATNLLTTGSHDDDFEGSNGSWAATAGSLANSSTFKYAGSNSMKMTQSAVSTVAESLKVTSAVEAHIYVGKAWMFRHAGDGGGTPPTQFQAWLRFYDASNVLISPEIAGPVQTIVNDVWMPIDVRAVAPALTAKVALKVGVPTGQGSSGPFWYVDQAGIFDVPAGT